MNNILYLFVNNWLLNFMYMFFMNHRLDIFMNNRLMVLMDYILMLLSSNIFVMLMYNILMSLFHYRSLKVLLDNRLIIMCYYYRFIFSCQSYSLISGGYHIGILVSISYLRNISSIITFTLGNVCIAISAFEILKYLLLCQLMMS